MPEYYDTHKRPVWAPWRIEYIRAPKDSQCFLCSYEQTRDQAIDDHVIACGSSCFVVLNKYPYNPGHLMVAPYRHVDDLEKMTTTEQTELFELLTKAQKVVKLTMNPEGFNVGCNLGKIAGAGLEEHIHFHLVPRWCGDTNFMPVVGDTRCVPEALQNTGKLLRENWYIND